MTEPSALELKFKILQKMALTDLCSVRLNLVGSPKERVLGYEQCKEEVKNLTY